ncbi:glucosyltransferase domain-containing protein [Pseudomonas alloputida]|uniref:glucosyltransferase domain-containing protein n=1 Tax=Pseudomonas TaxID=286 RepID=UPI003EEDF21A
MPPPPSWDKPLTPVELWLICCAALLLHVLPLLMADMPFLDDYAREHLARNDWMDVGRPLMVALYAALSFAPAAVNLYPLPLLLAVLVTGYALVRLLRYWFETPSLSSVLLVLPLWFQPYFLQNLSYQYDGASMALSMAAAVWAITLGTQHLRGGLCGVLLVTVGAALYQPSVNVFAGLCALEVMRRVTEGDRGAVVCRLAAARAGQLLLGVLLYYASSAWLVASTRGGLLPLDGRWLAEVLARMRTTTEVVSLLITPGNAWLFALLLLCAALALLRESQRVWQRSATAGERLGLMAALLMPVALTLLCVPGFILMLAEFEQSVRVLMGLGVLLMLLYVLVHRALARWPRLRLLALAAPLLFMLSFSFAYGRVLVLQKALHQSIAQMMAHDLLSFGKAEHYYVLGYWLKRPWIPAAAGTLQAMPAMAKVHAYNYLVLPEMLPRVGIDELHTFYQPPPLDRQQVLAASPTPQVSNRFYEIHRVGDDAYVLVKPPEGYGQ